jgi:osmotically inducible protein OsmC
MPRPIVSTASTTWKGDLLAGSGETRLDTSGLGTFPVTWKARAEESGAGVTSPEELIAAAHATCFSQQFAHLLAQNGTPSTTIATSADVTFVVGSGITQVHLTTDAAVPGISEADFERIAQEAKATCPVSLALTGTSVSLSATLA